MTTSLTLPIGAAADAAALRTGTPGSTTITNNTARRAAAARDRQEMNART